MRRKKRIELLEERVSELEALLDELDERIDQLKQQPNKEEGAKGEGVSTSRLLSEWLNGEEGAHG